jgi:hypothetical protein
LSFRKIGNNLAFSVLDFTALFDVKWTNKFWLGSLCLVLLVEELRLKICLSENASVLSK